MGPVCLVSEVIVRLVDGREVGAVYLVRAMVVPVRVEGERPSLSVRKSSIQVRTILVVGQRWWYVMSRSRLNFVDGLGLRCDEY